MPEPLRQAAVTPPQATTPQALPPKPVEHARRAQGVAIRSVTVQIGALSGVVAEAVEFAFDVCSKGTMAEGARLDILKVAGRGRCLDCRAEAELDRLTHVCPRCGSLALEILQGQELKFTEMEID